MVQDLGFGQEVLDNALVLMGLQTKKSADAKCDNGELDSTINQALHSLSSASPHKLYTPLHVASVLVVACKLCRGWETWKISNLHSDASNRVEFVPWNDAQLHLVGNGPTLDYYVDFLENTALNGLECSSDVKQFFETLEGDLTSLRASNQNGIMSEAKRSSIDLKVKPNHILSGVPNPSESCHRYLSGYSDYAIETRQDGIYKRRRKTGENLYFQETSHPGYLRLIEYVCYILEETNPSKLHKLVTHLENELLMIQKAAR
jgi:hypothetical protein